MKILPASWILNKSLKGWPLTYSETILPPQFKTFQVRHLKANFSEKHQHPISNLPVCSPTLTVELGLLWNPEYESIPPTKQGTISSLVFGRSFNIACHLRGMKRIVYHLLQSQPLPPSYQQAFICSLIYTNNDHITALVFVVGFFFLKEGGGLDQINKQHIKTVTGASYNK